MDGMMGCISSIWQAKICSSESFHATKQQKQPKRPDPSSVQSLHDQIPWPCRWRNRQKNRSRWLNLILTDRKRRDNLRFHKPIQDSLFTMVASICLQRYWHTNKGSFGKSERINNLIHFIISSIYFRLWCQNILLPLGKKIAILSWRIWPTAPYGWSCGSSSFTSPPQLMCRSGTNSCILHLLCQGFTWSNTNGVLTCPDVSSRC